MSYRFVLKRVVSLDAVIENIEVEIEIMTVVIINSLMGFIM
jgi:hypothetical protein